jgi:hypothetical protein
MFIGIELVEAINTASDLFGQQNIETLIPIFIGPVASSEYFDV